MTNDNHVPESDHNSKYEIDVVFVFNSFCNSIYRYCQETYIYIDFPTYIFFSGSIHSEMEEGQQYDTSSDISEGQMSEYSEEEEGRMSVVSENSKSFINIFIVL